MTLDQYIKELKKQAKKLESTKAVLLAASSAHEAAVERIFTDGNATSGGDIGSYNTSDPLYIAPIDSPKGFTTTGKTGKNSFKNGQPHKTKYFKSYSSFRASIGRSTSKVNLDLFGSLKSDYENSLSRKSNTTFESNIRTKSNRDKAKGNQRRFGKSIFGASENEREIFSRVLQYELRKIYD